MTHTINLTTRDHKEISFECGENEHLIEAAAKALTVGRADSAPRLADLVESLIKEDNGANGGGTSSREEAA